MLHVFRGLAIESFIFSDKYLEVNLALVGNQWRLTKVDVCNVLMLGY